MDNVSYRNNRPPAQRPESVAASAAQPSAVASNPHRERVAHGKTSKPSKRKFLLAGLILAILLVALAGWYFLKASPIASTIDGDKYQVVVLRDATGTPNYFGKLSVINSDYMRLTDVYYLQKKDADTTADQSVETQDASDFQLTKLGNEIHGPEDEMIIHTDQILYFENLKPTGTVSKAIIDNQKKE